MARRSDVNIRADLEQLIEVIRCESNPVCRADALILLFEAVYPKNKLRQIVLVPLLEACEIMKSWKQPRLLKDLSLILAIDNLLLANKVVEMIQKPSIKRQAIKEIEEAKWLGPHQFFPYYQKKINFI